MENLAIVLGICLWVSMIFNFKQSVDVYFYSTLADMYKKHAENLRKIYTGRT